MCFNTTKCKNTVDKNVSYNNNRAVQLSGPRGPNTLRAISSGTAPGEPRATKPQAHRYSPPQPCCTEQPLVPSPHGPGLILSSLSNTLHCSASRDGGRKQQPEDRRGAWRFQLQLHPELEGQEETRQLGESLGTPCGQGPTSWTAFTYRMGNLFKAVTQGVFSTVYSVDISKEKKLWVTVDNCFNMTPQSNAMAKRLM